MPPPTPAATAQPDDDLDEDDFLAHVERVMADARRGAGAAGPLGWTPDSVSDLPPIPLPAQPPPPPPLARVPVFSETLPTGPGRDHRLSRRRPTRPGGAGRGPGGALGLGPDLSLGLVDVSAGGVCVRLADRLVIGDEVEVGLGRPGGGKLLTVRGAVRWCRPDGEAFLAGLWLVRRLTHADLLDLAR